MATVVAKAAPLITADSPIGFFTNVAARLLKDVNVDLRHIEVYPTNQYTPAVHRLLQVTANLYDATTTNFYPTIFRPYFSAAEGTNVFISGYEQVDSTNLAALTMPVALADAVISQSVSNDTRVNIYGVPWILGAKKGLPNFNEVVLQNVFQITRKLQVVRPPNSTWLNTDQVNQMLILSVSNVLGMEAWNSYSPNYPRTIFIQTGGALNVSLTNDFGMSMSTNCSVEGKILVLDQWKGWRFFNTKSFQIPFFTNLIFLPPSVYHYDPPGLVPITVIPSFETNAGFPNPHWILTSAGRIHCAIIDAGPPARLIDYVQLDGPSTFLDVNQVIQTPDFPVGSPIGFNSLWSTNLIYNYLSIPAPAGIVNQLGVALGDLISTDDIWPDPFRNVEIEYFRRFVFGERTNLTMECPFAVWRAITQTISWQANDPLVHYLAADLVDTNFEEVSLVFPPGSAFSEVSTLGWPNLRHRPWGGSPFQDPDADADAFNLALKDPLVFSSDDWNFPTGQPLEFSWLGRVHRGTPWQTIYLKSPIAELDQWKEWTGIFDTQQAALTHPTNDWRLAGLWASWFNTNQLSSLFSVNNRDASAWRGLFDGLITVTNSSPTDSIVIASNSPQALVIADAIESIRDNQPEQLFHDAGDILITPELTVELPWLNVDSDQVQYGISDEVYEGLVSQLMPLLRADSIGTISLAQNQSIIRFTGYYDHSYAIEMSTNLFYWTRISTNLPDGGFFNLTNTVTQQPKFFRSVLLQ